jgi:hypothetical protein
MLGNCTGLLTCIGSEIDGRMLHQIVSEYAGEAYAFPTGRKSTGSKTPDWKRTWLSSDPGLHEIVLRCMSAQGAEGFVVPENRCADHSENGL